MKNQFIIISGAACCAVLGFALINRDSGQSVSQTEQAVSTVKLDRASVKGTDKLVEQVVKVTDQKRTQNSAEAFTGESKYHQSVRNLFEFDNSLTRDAIYQLRLLTVQKLSLAVSGDEKAHLYDFLKNEQNDTFTLHVKDEIMLKLEDQLEQGEFVPALVDIINDQDLDGDLRGYATQHLRTAYHSNVDQREVITKSLENGLNDHSSDVSGTAILALSELAKNYPEHFDLQKIEDSALDLANDSSLHIPSRITAMRVCGMMGIENAAQTARDLAINADDKVLKMAAIASLAELGDSSDLNLLYKLQSESLPLFAKTVTRTISILEKK